MSNQKIWVASFDIGKVNFAFYIEEIELGEFKNIKNIAKAKRYNENGTCTEGFENIMQKVYKNGKRILLKNFNLTSNVDKKKYFDLEICYNLIDYLDLYSEYWDNVSYFIIEQQMSFGRKTNTMALKIGQHCASYFMFKYGRFRKVVEFPSYHKTQVLGAEKQLKDSSSKKTTKKVMRKKWTLEKYARKKWAIEKAKSILELREDHETLESLTKSRKKDDISDVICQLQAWKYLKFIDTTGLRPRAT